VRVAKLLAPLPASITTVSPSIIPRGLAAATITVTGSSASGRGFFDPGTGFACRLAASIPGVTVTNVQYNSPTSVTLTINTVGATNGLKNLTITNPDGQTSALNNAIQIVSGTPETIGIFRPSNFRFYLRNSNTGGIANQEIFFGGDAADIPVAGDWNGDGKDTPGIYRNGVWYLTDQSTTGAAAANYTVIFGIAGDQPFVGDWNGDGKDTLAVLRPSIGTIFLRNTLTNGPADLTMTFGAPGDVGIGGDWNGDGTDSPGIYRPTDSTFHITNQVCTCAVPADAIAAFGLVGDVPVTGDWNGDGTTTIGVFRPGGGRTFLKNSIGGGFADIDFLYGIAGDKPVAGHWIAGSPALISEPAPSFDPNK
jgi:hypothetical protein